MQEAPGVDEKDASFMRVAITLARRAREKGNHPFGAVLVGPDGRILVEAENTTVTERDCTGHAETNLMRRASREYNSDLLARCTLYTSTEPCPMCAGAIFWGDVRRVVYGLSQEGLYALIGRDAEEVLYLPCREIFSRGQKPIEVTGPILEDEARSVHEGFWA